MKATRCLSSVALMLLSACATAPLDLQYSAAPRPVEVSASVRSGSIGIWPFEDARGWGPNVVARQIRLLTGEIPLTVSIDSKAAQDAVTVVADALRIELAARGFRVKSEPAVPGWTWGQYREVLAAQAPPLDRVVTGRVHFFQWLEPGFAGLAFQALLPKAKAYVAIDVVVLDRSGTSVWAGHGASKVVYESSLSSAPGPTLLAALKEALQGVLEQPAFIESLSLDSTNEARSD